MNVTTRRVVFVVTAVLLIATAATITATTAVGAPKSGTDFTIKTHLDGNFYWGFSGDFRAGGAVAGSGGAYYDFSVLEISGDYGTMVIEIVITQDDGKKAHGTFWIVAADGAYADLVGATGTYAENLMNYRDVWTYPEEQPEWHLSQTLKGSLPE